MEPALRVLVVEDEVWVRRGLVKILRTDLGIEVADAGTGAAGLALARQTPPDVALVDLGLPDLSGIEVSAALRPSVPACIPLVFTMYDDAPTILSALRAGARPTCAVTGSGHPDHGHATEPSRPRARPEKCCDGVAVIRSPPISVDSFQSSSVIRTRANPNSSRCAPTPSAVTIGTCVRTSATIVALHR